MRHFKVPILLGVIDQLRDTLRRTHQEDANSLEVTLFSCPMTYFLLTDYQYRYIHHLQRIWFDDYANSTGVSISEASQARDKVEWSGDGLPDDPAQDKTMRVGIPGHPYIIHGTRGFRYQDILPTIDIQRLNVIFQELSDRHRTSAEYQTEYVELCDLLESTYFKQYLIKGPNADTKKEFIRPKLFQQMGEVLGGYPRD